MPVVTQWLSVPPKEALFGFCNFSVDWIEVLTRLRRKKLFSSFSSVLTEIGELPPLDNDLCFIHEKEGDERSRLGEITLPEQLQKQFVPLVVPADGHCFVHSLERFRSGRVVGPGLSATVAEWRVRLAKELADHRDDYLNSRFLEKGLAQPVPDYSLPTVLRFVSYTDFFLRQKSNMGLFSGKNSSEYIKKAFDEEVMLHVSGYMGLWSMAATANVLDRPVRSVYPNYTESSLVADHNRLFLPRSEEGCTRDAISIFWCQADGAPTGEQLDHFAPLVLK